MTSPRSFYRQLPLLGRTRRRVAVVAAFGGYPLLQLGYSSLVAPGLVGRTVWAPIAVALFGVTLVGVFVVYGYARERMVPVWFPFLANPPASRHPLDERQRAMHDRALVVSYRIVTLVVGLTIGAAAGIASNEPLVIDFPTLLPFIVVFALYQPFLPFAALAWIERDPPADDDRIPGRAASR